MGIIHRMLRRVFQIGKMLKGIWHKTRRKVHVNSINRIMLHMINKERRKRHLQPVVFDAQLERHAKKWSKHMANRKELSHSGVILENACMVPSKGSPIKITKNMFYCWKGSTPHWNWMMNPSIRKAGFGYWKRGQYAYGAFAFE